jgi:HdeA/HdeB family protein
MNRTAAAFILIAGVALASCAGGGAMPGEQAPPPSASGEATAPAPIPALAPQPAPALAPQQAGEPLFAPGQAWQVRRFTCARLLAAPERDRNAATMFYYGYLAGRTKLEVIDTNKMDGDLRRVMNECARNPGQTVTDAFQQKLSKTPRWIWQQP